MRNKRLLILTLSLFIAIPVLHAAETVSAQADQETIQLTSSSLWEGSPVWSPDGTRILYQVSRDAPFDTDIWVMNADGSDKRQLTTSSKVEAYPSWSPDGTKIVYASDQSGNRDIWVMNPDGSNKRQLTTSSKIETYPSWSPDGTRIIYETESGSYDTHNVDIWIMNADGTGKLQLTTDVGEERFCSLSLTGKIAYEKYMGNLNWDIWVMELDGSNNKRLTTGRAQETGPLISPDGTKVAFSAFNEIWVVDSDGSNKRRLSTGWMRVREASWSPDGTKIAYIDGHPFDVYVINADGTGKTRLTAGTTYELDPMWSPDGTRIAYVSAKSTDLVGEANIWVMTLDSKALAGTRVPVPNIVLNPAEGPVDTLVEIGGTGFEASGTVVIKYDGEAVATAMADSNGIFVAAFRVPASKFGDHTITASDGTHTEELTFTVESQAPKTPPPLWPEMGIKVKSPIYFEWRGVTDESSPVTYTLQIATNKDFTASSIILEKTGLTNIEYILTEEEKLKLSSTEMPYYWRIRAIDAALNEGEWTGAGEFYVAAPFSSLIWILYAVSALLSLLIVWLIINTFVINPRRERQLLLENEKAKLIAMIDKALKKK